MQAFREWLRATLDERGWTNADLERASGVSNSIIWRWLTDPPRRPSDTNLKRIAPALGVPYEELAKMCGYLPGEPVLAHLQDAEFAARTNEFQAALHDVPRRFWAAVLTASIALAKAYGEAPTAETPPVSDPQVPPVSAPISPQTRGKSVPKRRLTSSQHHAQPIAAYA